MSFLKIKLPKGTLKFALRTAAWAVRKLDKDATGLDDKIADLLDSLADDTEALKRLPDEADLPPEVAIR